MKKLTKAQQAVVDKMREGVELIFIFPPTVYRSAYPELDGQRVGKRTIDSLIGNGVIEYSHKTHGAITRHYYHLTEQYKTAP